MEKIFWILLILILIAIIITISVTIFIISFSKKIEKEDERIECTWETPVLPFLTLDGKSSSSLIDSSAIPDSFLSDNPTKYNYCANHCQSNQFCSSFIMNPIKNSCDLYNKSFQIIGSTDGIPTFVGVKNCP